MVIRIMEAGQYRIEDPALITQFERFDDSLNEAAAKNDGVGFVQALGELVTFIQQNGQVVPFTEVIPSDVVVPAADMTLEDASEILPFTTEDASEHA